MLIVLSVLGFYKQPPIKCGESTRTMERSLLSADYSEGQNHSWETGIAKEQKGNRNEEAEEGDRL